MQDRFIELTRTNGTQITLNVAHITAVGFDKVTLAGEAKGTPPEEKTFVTTSAGQILKVQEDYPYVSSIVRRAQL